MVVPVVASGLHLDHVGELGRLRSRPGGAGRVGSGNHDELRRCAGGRMFAEIQPVVVALHLVRAGCSRGTQAQGVAVAQRRAVRRFGEDFHLSAGTGTTVSAAVDVQRCLRTAVIELAGNTEGVGLDGSAIRCHDADEVGAVGATGDGLAQVRVADESLQLAGVRVCFGVGRTDPLQERPDVAVQGTGEITRCTDADVAGHVDPAAAGAGDVDFFHAIGVDNGVQAGSWDGGANTNPGEADLVPINGVFGGKRRFHGGYINLQLEAAIADRRDIGFGGEPEQLTWEVVRKHHGLGVVINPGFCVE
ncbi:hypothetical protein D9M71_377920 [compost metagenome]